MINLSPELNNRAWPVAASNNAGDGGFSLPEIPLSQDLEITANDLDNLHQEETNSQEKQNPWRKFQKSFTEGGPPGFQLFRDKFTMLLNYVGIAFNTLAAIATNRSIFPKEVAKFIEEKAEWFSRYMIPFGFGWNALEAFVGERPIEMVSRLIPAVSFWFLPFYNFNLTTGMSSGINYLLELVKNRHGGENPGNSMMENVQETLKTAKDIFKDMVNFNYSRETFAEQLATALMMSGSVLGFMFAQKDRDSFMARMFGNMRNIGGLIADKDLIFNKDTDKARSTDKRIVGTSCITASILNMLMRWVGPELARPLNHIAIALDDFGLTYWAQSSKRDNDVKRRSTQSNKTLHLAM